MSSTLRAATYIDKGGTGKTTSTAHLGVALQQEGYNTLLIDLAGKQDDLATIFGLDGEVQADLEQEDDYPNVATTMEERWPDIADMLGDEEAVNRLVYQTDEGVDLIPAHPSLDSLDGNLGNIDDVEERYSRLKRFVDNYVSPLYDAVLLDLPGAPNNLTYNGLWAAQSVIAPVQLGPLEAKQAARLRNDLETIRDQYHINPRLQLLIPNMLDRRTKLDSEILEELNESFSEVVAPEPVVKTQSIRNATAEGHTLFDIDEEELSKTGKEARNAIEANAKELITRLNSE